MAKKTCAICGKPIGLLTGKTEIADGFVCGNCIAGTGVTAFTNGNHFTAASLPVWIENRKQMVSNFSPTKKIVKNFTIDENNKLFMVSGNLFSYENLLSFELLEDGESITKGGLGRAVAGGLIFGPVGAIVGGVTGGKKSKGLCKSMRIRVTLRNAHTDTLYIDLITSETKTNSLIYKNAQNTAQSCLSALQIIADINNTNSAPAATAEPSASAADELLKFKQLLDAGIISQDEFDAKKKQLLGL